MKKTDTIQLNILGTRGVPASHGGFETFAERLCLYLAQSGHDVTVYCQLDNDSETGRYEDEWQGVKRVHIRPKYKGALGTMEFDLRCILDVGKRSGVDLVLGYNTALFCLIQRLSGRKILMNMDGIEWKRAKWPILAKIWFFINELAGANICHVAIADHPEIAQHVKRRSFKDPVVIPYGGDVVRDVAVDPLQKIGLEANNYFVSISRIEPENSILEIVKAFSRIRNGTKLVVLGNLDPHNKYHTMVQEAASENVIFPGAIYEQETVQALRYYCKAYIHGHQVGGTNPSLVEALGARNAVIAHDNKYNRWTAGADQMFFTDETDCEKHMRTLCESSNANSIAKDKAMLRHQKDFVWDDVLRSYMQLIRSV